MENKRNGQKGTGFGLLEYLGDPSLILNYSPKYLHHSTRERICGYRPALVFLRACSMRYIINFAETAQIGTYGAVQVRRAQSTSHQ